VIYTGPVDEYFGYKLGYLEYRSLRFEEEYMEDVDNFQGNAAVNYASADVPYTRIIEHKHFEFGKGDGTVITREYPSEWKPGDEPYYPVNNDRNSELYNKYKEMADAENMSLASIERKKREAIKCFGISMYRYAYRRECEESEKESNNGSK
jgi:UDP-galactopyranose mutase